MPKNDKDLVLKKFGTKVTWDESSENAFFVDTKNLIDVMKFLKSNGYDFLSDITSVDYKDKFRVIYQLFQFAGSGHLTVKVDIDHENPEINTLCGLWDSANWLEREVYDMMGIRFKNHPNLKRILMWEGFDGFPLRKDFVHKPTKYQGRRALKR